MISSRTFLPLLVVVASMSMSARVQADAAAEMARKAQDPLGDVKALMTDNTIGVDAGPNKDTAYGFQLQPVYSIPNETSYNMIARGIVPIVGTEPGAELPRLGPNPRPTEGDKWGISDIILQYFFSPKTDGGVKWGIGPQVSLKTRTSDRQAGPGWGAGVAGVIFGTFGNWAMGAVAFQHWGNEQDFSVATVQPIVNYNFESVPGMYIGYNNAITHNWNADSGQRTTVPLGLTVGRTIVLGNGDGLDMSVGFYDLVKRPDDAPEWQFKFGLSYFFN